MLLYRYYYIIVFFLLVSFMFLIDLGIFNKKKKDLSIKDAALQSIMWIGLALAFGLFLFFNVDKEMATAYFSAYIVEKVLSVDNLFVFILIFSFFNVPKIYQRKILIWGILGSIFMRGMFIFIGSHLINYTHITHFKLFDCHIRSFNPILFFFGFTLVYGSLKSIFNKKETKISFSENKWIKGLKKIIPLKENFHNGHFFVKENKRWYATMLFLVLITIEMTDLIFAIDSIPAIFTISSDPFVLYTSNIFAILGLRSLYFLLIGVLKKLKYLNYGLSLVLLFIGLKMILDPFYHLSGQFSLLIIICIITFSILISVTVLKNNNEQ